MTTWDFLEKTGISGGGWTYDEGNLAYDDLQDPDTGNVVYYNGFGSEAVWSLLAKTITVLLVLTI
jgi:hypothetical protein